MASLRKTLGLDLSPLTSAERLAILRERRRAMGRREVLIELGPRELEWAREVAAREGISVPAVIRGLVRRVAGA